MKLAAAYFNTHSNMNRVDHEKWCGYCKAPAILKKDEKAYSLAMEKNKDAKRKPSKISLAPLPF